MATEGPHKEEATVSLSLGDIRILSLELQKKALIEMLEEWQTFDSRIHTAVKIAELHLKTRNLLLQIKNGNTATENQAD